MRYVVALLLALAACSDARSYNSVPPTDAASDDVADTLAPIDTPAATDTPAVIDVAVDEGPTVLDRPLPPDLGTDAASPDRPDVPTVVDAGPADTWPRQGIVPVYGGSARPRAATTACASSPRAPPRPKSCCA